MDSTIFGEDGRLKTGWVMTNVQTRLAGELRRQSVRLCSATGTDLTDDILNVLDEADSITDILIKADADGRYQAILLGGRETFNDVKLGIHPTFHVIYLCSIVSRGGTELMRQVQSYVSQPNAPVRSITLEPLQEVVRYYKEKLGFKTEPLPRDGEDNWTLIWYPEMTAGRRRKTLRRRKSRRRTIGL